MPRVLRVAGAVVAAVGAAPAWAGMNNFFLAPVPTLDEIGLGALIALVAGVAGYVLRRRGKR